MQKKRILRHTIAAAAFLLLTAYQTVAAVELISSSGFNMAHVYLPVGYALVSLGTLLGRKIPIMIGFAVTAFHFGCIFAVNLPLLLFSLTLVFMLLCLGAKAAAMVLLLGMAAVDYFPQWREKLRKMWGAPAVLFLVGNVYFSDWIAAALFCIGALLLSRWLLDIQPAAEITE